MIDFKRQIYLVGFRALFIDFARSLSAEQLEDIFTTINLEQATMLRRLIEEAMDAEMEGKS